MKSIFFKQLKPVKVKMFGVLLLVLALYLLFFVSFLSIQHYIVLLLALALLSYSEQYEIDENSIFYKYLNVFGITISKRKSKLPKPDFISIFPTSFKQNNDWSTVSALGTKSGFGTIAIKIFNKNKHFTLFKTEDYELASKKAYELGDMLKVEVKDKTKR